MKAARYKKGAWTDPARDSEGRALCRWCEKPVGKGRRTFCSDACVHEWRLRSDGQYLRREVFKRDRGICALCRLDCEPTRRRMAELAELANSPSTAPEERDRARAEYHQVRGSGPPPTERWEADHVLPVVEGGGQCGLENIRTLCRPCHKGVTAELAARRARERRASVQPQLPLAGGSR